MINVKDLDDSFEYNSLGYLTWKKDNKRRKAGDKAGYQAKNGYIQIYYNNELWYAHRLIFVLHHGYLPEMIDHKDNNPFNNKIENLRPASKMKNSQNSKIRSDNTSGIKGVSWSKLRNKWRVYLSVNKKIIHLGLHDELEFAELVISEARLKYHGDFARFA